MKAVILAGGKGRRLRPFTTVLPKPLMPLGEMPIVEVVLRQLAANGFEGDAGCRLPGRADDGLLRRRQQISACAAALLREEQPLGTSRSAGAGGRPGRHLPR